MMKKRYISPFPLNLKDELLLMKSFMIISLLFIILRMSESQIDLLNFLLVKLLVLKFLSLLSNLLLLLTLVQSNSQCESFNVQFLRFSDHISK